MGRAPHLTTARVLIVDDNLSIHDDFRKILAPQAAANDLGALEAALFGASETAWLGPNVELSFASQGEEALTVVERSLGAGRSFDVAFVDVRMPPGLDGVETVLRLWQLDPRVQVVLCTAYSDYGWEEMAVRLGSADSYLVLKKPFDSVEARQLVQSLTEKRALLLEREARLAELDDLVRERTAELASSNARLALEMGQRLRTEQQLHKSQKLESLGRLAACMGHEINNPLSYILLNAEEASSMLAERGPLADAQRSELRAMMGEVTAGVHRIATLVHHLKVFSGSPRDEAQPFSINDVIDSAISLVGNEIRHRAMLVRNLTEGLPQVVGEANRIEQVFMNLFLNAAQSIPHGNVGGNTVRVSTRLSAPDELCIEVTDSGVGISSGISSGCSTRSTRRRASGRGPAWAWRSATRSSRPTAGGSGSPARRAPAPP